MLDRTIFQAMVLHLAALTLSPVQAADRALPAGVTRRDGAVVVGGRVLVTHARRGAFPPAGGSLIVPAAERDLFEHPERFWAELETARFHDYSQKSTGVPVRPAAVSRAVSDGDVLPGSPAVRVIATPGYTAGAVSYLFELGGKRIAATGDLIYGDGQLLDLYSLQDAVPEAKARGYHGYAARAGDLIASLRKVGADNPDLLIPSHGPAITNPRVAIANLIDRLQRFLASHYATDALRWYWGDENYRIRSRAVERPAEVMPMAEQAKLPGDIVAIGNSRLILSQSGSAFLVDAGYSRIIPELGRLAGEGRFRKLEGLWITHYHDDHTDRVAEVSRTYDAPVYFTERMTEVLRSPGSFRLPCLTTGPIPVSGAKRDGESLRWHEWTFRFLYFPGQTLYHGGLSAVHDDGRSYFFVGDSFTPSGMDDYCMQNRVLLREGEGYSQCFRKMEQLPKQTWLINQHVEPMFRYTDSQMATMRAELEKRSAVLRELSPWPDINFMVDESWARIHPYGTAVDSGREVELELRILNHAPQAMTYDVSWNLPEGFRSVRAERSVSIPPHAEGKVKLTVQGTQAGLHVVTADIRVGHSSMNHTTEALVRVR